MMVAGGALLALRPYRRPWPLGVASNFLGPLIGELPFFACYWLVATAALANVEGDLATTMGRIAFGLAVLTLPVLAMVAWRGWRAGPPIDAAMAEALGGNWKATLDPGLAARLPRRLPWARILLRPFLVFRTDVRRRANLRYGPAGRYHRLDVYHRRSRPQGGPVMVYFHGGRFVGGSKKREGRPLLYRLASQGWICVSANYRLSPAVEYPDQLIDVKRVIAWARDHAGEYGGDPGLVFTAGSSAGAHLAASAGLSPNDPVYQPGFEAADTSVAAVVCLYGYYGPQDGDPRSQSSPVNFLNPGAPPFFVTHGDLDPYVDVAHAREFVAQLRAASSQPVVYAELPGGAHAFDLFHSMRFERVVNAVVGFTAWVRSRPPRQPRTG
jgi:acetyl esterase/lipase